MKELFQKRFYLKCLATNAQNIYTDMANGRPTANIHRIGIAVLAFGIELLAMGMTIEGAIKACASEQVSPQGATGRTGTARIVGLVVKPEGCRRFLFFMKERSGLRD